MKIFIYEKEGSTVLVIPDIPTLFAISPGMDGFLYFQKEHPEIPGMMRQSKEDRGDTKPIEIEDQVIADLMQALSGQLAGNIPEDSELGIIVRKFWDKCNELK